MKLLPALLLALLLTAPAQAASQKDIAFIENINATLDQFGTGSKLKIAYEDVSLVDSGYAGKFYAFEDPTITHIASGVKYVLSARSLALKQNGNGTYSGSMPATLHLVLSQEGSSQLPYHLELRFSGVPELKLQVRNNQILKYDIDAPDYIDIRTGVITEGAARSTSRGKIRFEGESIDTKGWQDITPITPATAVTDFLKAVVAAERPKTSN